jgi:hypothetical protein
MLVMWVTIGWFGSIAQYLLRQIKYENMLMEAERKRG